MVAQAKPTDPNAPVKAEGVSGWAWVILLLISLTLVGLGTIPRIIKDSNSARQSTVTTLACGEKWVEPHKTGTTHFVVPPSPDGCWTNIVYRPNTNGRLSPKFLADIKSDIWIEFCRPDGTWEDAYETNPSDNSIHQGVTAVRFMNEGTEPVYVDIIVS